MSRIESAGCLIIGDEVLNGKILDTNSYHFARHCFNDLSIPLKRTIVCGDDKQDITKSLDLLLNQDKVDYVVTSGGLGSTHDDITYEVLANYFGVECGLDDEVVQRMKSIRSSYLEKLNPEQVQAFYKMATLPISNATTNVSKIYVDDSLWFPIVAINHRVYVLPGVPSLFTKLISALESHIKARIPLSDTRLVRFYVKTVSGETQFAPYLTRLQDSVDEKFGAQVVKIGSYPHFNWKNTTISIIGRIPDVSLEELRLIVDDVVGNVGGDATEISQVDEDKLTNEDPKL
jgi:molybdopterin-biosynthesis enzyme MoeA-like protein